MIIQILKGLLTAVVILSKVITVPIKFVWKRLKRRGSVALRSQTDFPGVYIVSNSPDSLKIGRSKHVLKRLKSYRGYQADGQDIQKLLLIRCAKHKELERLMHEFAADCELKRMGRTEVFKCSNKPRFIKNAKEYIKTLHRRGLRSDVIKP